MPIDEVVWSHPGYPNIQDCLEGVFFSLPDDISEIFVGLGVGFYQQMPVFATVRYSVVEMAY
jgi:hypothetical protein